MTSGGVAAAPSGAAVSVGQVLDEAAGRRSADIWVIAVGFALVVMAAAFWLLAPTGRVVFDPHRLPPVSKRDLIAGGLVVAGFLTLVSSTRLAAVRRLLGLAAIAVGTAWLLTSHRFEGEVVASVTRRHGFHRNDWLAVFPLVIGLAMQLPWPPRGALAARPADGVRPARR